MADSREFPGIPEREFPVALLYMLSIAIFLTILIADETLSITRTPSRYWGQEHGRDLFTMSVCYC